MPLTSPPWQPAGQGYWFPYYGSKRRRWLSSDVSPSGRILEAYASGGNAMFRFPSSFGISTWAETDTGIAADFGVVRYLPDSRILFVTQVSGSIYRQTTASEGKVFTVATSVMDGKFPAVCISLTGSEVHFCIKSTGAINTKVLSAQGTVAVPERQVVAAGVAVATEPIACFFRYGLAYLVYKNSSGTITTVSSGDLLTYL